jgi:methyl-accepting chemotaxis protein
MKQPLLQSLRLRIPLLVMLGVIPPMLIGIQFASSRAGQIIHDDAQNKLALETQSLKNNVSRWTQMNVLALQNLSRQPAMLSLDAKQQTPILKELVNTYNHLYLVSTTSLNGINLARSDDKPAKDYNDRYWFQSAKSGKDITWETLIGKTSKKPAVCISTPIKAQKVIQAVAQICSNLDDLSERVGATKIGKTGYAFVVDNAGKVVAHPDPALSSGEELADFSNYPPVKSLLATTETEGYLDFTDDQGIEWVAYGTRIDNGWGVIVAQQKAEAFLQEREFKEIALTATLIVLIITSIITIAIANRLVMPISELTEAAADLAAGDLDRSVNLDRADELGTLAQSFNQMAMQLKESFTALEKRSSDLNALLEQQNESEREQRIAKEELQKQVRQLQAQIEPVQRGDLTVRATVSDEEIGKLADSYNSTIANLSKIVAQVQNITQTVTKTTNRNETTIVNLSEGALQQTQEITSILDRLQAMTKSMQIVARDAQNAEKTTKAVVEKVKEGDGLVGRTVERIQSLGRTASETTEQVKRLSKASRKISKAVQLIRKIALQTNVLAVNASIEAVRAGEEGLGFTVVADEVQSLATQSAQAATDIEKLVAEIQLETSKVVKAMEKSTSLVLEESNSVADIRQALEQITTASAEIDRLVEAVTNVIVEQSQTSQNLTQTMETVAAISQHTSTAAMDVSSSFQELLSAAQQLETSVGQFKVR